MANHIDDLEDSNFEITSKRRKGFPSETQVKRGVRIVHGNKQLFEKLGRNDLCPLRFRTQLLRSAASAPGATTVQGGITFFRE
jgi:hypothetical protein